MLTKTYGRKLKVSIRMPVEVHDQLKFIADTVNMPLSTIVAMLVNSQLLLKFPKRYCGQSVVVRLSLDGNSLKRWKRTAKRAGLPMWRLLDCEVMEIWKSKRDAHTATQPPFTHALTANNHAAPFTASSPLSNPKVSALGNGASSAQRSSTQKSANQSDWLSLAKVARALMSQLAGRTATGREITATERRWNK